MKVIAYQTRDGIKPFRGVKVGVYWHGGGWYCAPYAADGVSHYQQTGAQTLSEANAEAESLERGEDPDYQGGDQ